MPLKEWDIRINYGIKTGFNDAFIISGEKKDELIAADPKSAQIIRPILRGRDIKRYSYNFADLWVIATFPSLAYDIEKYPAVKKHLLSFGMERLEQTGKEYAIDGKKFKARKKTNNKWFETQDSISYWDDFSKQKIIWGEISDKSKFCFDENGFLLDVTTFFMTGNHLKYLLAILNSRLCEWMFNQIGTTTGVGTNRWKKYKLETLFVKTPSISEENKLGSLIDKLREKEYYDKELILDIDMSIYKLYNINNTEIEFLNSY